MRSFVVCCALGGALLLTGCGGDGARKTLEGRWNCSNFITVRVDPERMVMTPLAVFGIPVPADDAIKFTLKNIKSDSLEMYSADGRGKMQIKFPDADTAEVRMASEKEIAALRRELPGFDGSFTCKRVK